MNGLKADSWSWPQYAADEQAAALRVLQSGKVNYWTGTEAREFEKEYAEQIGIPYAIAVANGTVSLELALRVLGIGSGDEVVTSPRTFIASASSAVQVGAVPVFADVDRDSQNITAESIERVLTRRTRAIVPVHLAGWPCEMDRIIELAASRKLFVIEDCAQANGAMYQGRPVGTFGHAGAFSFCQDKIITTGGEGGLLVTNQEAVWRSAWAYKDHGKSFDAVYRREHPPGYRWLHESFGTNWRMTEIQAAIGRIQLRKLPEWNQMRARNASLWMQGLKDLAALRIPVVPNDIRHAWYKFYCFVRPEALRAGWTRDRIMAEINSQGVRVFSGSCSEVYLEKAFSGSLSVPVPRLPVARELGETSLMFLVHPTLSEDDIQAAVRIVRDCVKRATLSVQELLPKATSPGSHLVD